jgi:LacI family transcriptional regulator
MVTLSDVAKVAGVSVTTASRVLNRGKYADRISKACTERVRKIAEEMGYTLSYHHRSIRTGRAEALGVALQVGAPGEYASHGPLVNNLYFLGLISGAEGAAHDVGYALTLIGPGREQIAVARSVAAVREKRLDGLVVAGVTLGPQSRQALEDSAGLPVVCVQPPAPTEVPSVDFDHAAGAALAARHLVGLGHRRLLWLGPDETPANVIREDAFLETARQAGAEAHACRFPAAGEKRRAGSHPFMRAAQAGFASWLDTPSRPTFTALACYNDAVAIAAGRVLMARGLRIPDDISLVGFDDMEAAYAMPALTTVDHRIAEMGRRAAQIALEMAEAGPHALEKFRGFREITTPALVVRESTAPPPEGKQV